jgi:transketolase
MPNLVIIRPADANETAAAWQVALQRRDGPTALILTRQKLPILTETIADPAETVARGAYVLADAPHTPDLILIATGSEVHLVLEARNRLQEEGLQARVVSMPSWELFEAQPASYRESVLLPQVDARLAVEAGAAMGWHKYVGPKGDLLCLDHYGASAPYQVLMEKFGFTPENIVDRARKLLDD